jgi:hypothetical protein
MGKTKTRSKTKSKLKTRKNKTFKQMNCSPSAKKLSFTCFTKEQLHKLKTLWNARHTDSKIKSNSSKTIWNSLKKNMKSTCSNESCWIKNNFSDDIDLQKSFLKSFAPSTPKSWNKNPNAWLSSIDINKVMKQYEEAYPEFNFIGPSPIDYNTILYDDKCVWQEICKFNCNKMLQKNKTKIGFIFNLDKHDQPGSHWVSLFSNLDNGNTYYFDSVGDAPPKEIINLMKNIKDQSQANSQPMKLHISKFPHQFGDTECGIYSLYFIIQMLKHNNFNKFQNSRISDKDIEKFRSIYFNKE